MVGMAFNDMKGTHGTNFTKHASEVVVTELKNSLDNELKSLWSKFNKFTFVIIDAHVCFMIR